MWRQSLDKLQDHLSEPQSRPTRERS
jgi:hypothetical protein